MYEKSFKSELTEQRNEFKYKKKKEKLSTLYIYFSI